MPLSRYQRQATLGEGAAGVVYRAHDTQLARDVAIKILRSSPASPIPAKRFDREARALARLSHPHVVAVYDFGQSPEGPFLVMELMPGETLQTRLDREQILPQREAVDLVRQLAEGIQHAHEQNLLHRDLKPENVLIDHEGRCKVTDFGLTRDIEMADSRSKLSISGTFLGTPGYWSPEQARGQPVGPETDVYGLGALLYACLTGRAPYVGQSMIEVVSQVGEPVEPPSGLRLGLDRKLEKLCLRCLALKPKQRFRSAADLAQALQSWLDGASTVAPVARRASGRPRRAVSARVSQRTRRKQGPGASGIAAAVGLALGALVLVKLLLPDASAPPTTSPVPSAGTKPNVGAGFTPALDAELASDPRLDPQPEPEASPDPEPDPPPTPEPDPEPSPGRELETAVLTDPELEPGYEFTSDPALEPLRDRIRALFATEAWEQALLVLDEAIAHYPETSLFYDNRANVHAALKDYPRGIADATRALELTPGDRRPCVLRGQCYLALGKRELARQDFEHYLELPIDAETTRIAKAFLTKLNAPPNRAQAVAARSRGYEAMQRGDMAGALRAFDRAIEFDPTYAWAHAQRAGALLMLGRPDEALAAIDTTLGLDPNNTEGLLYRAQLKRRNGDPQGALADFERAERSHPVEKWGTALEEMYRELRRELR